ncbi:uncharacterized protein UV8b_04628 [Ustilaginoidea virens]|uniref:Methyltransferase n=1 Tax=Ustilaginoidea virens TaxID=1159556 RepID=A0A8E5MHX1_USTVR|nr:uncharacterized protein UV8b_04628 [Ustilaginoidea virens]QUC20387.1 hypothetical protein UV8b_04628 [Ustilaginoidea virens]
MQMYSNDEPGDAQKGEPPANAPTPHLQGFEFTFESSSLRFEVDSDAMNDASSLSDISLSDSIQEYPKLFGRTYNAYRHGSYAFPNDQQEQERLALQGPVLTRLMGGKLYFAPLSNLHPPRFILDIATGIGDWAIDMADEFPETTVIGTDLSPIQPNKVPPNVHFYIEDSSEKWDFPQKFDYIHTRISAGCWSNFETQAAAQAFQALEPGGWFESQEVDCTVCCDDGTVDPDGPLVAWANELIEASAKVNRPALIGSILKETYERVGFVDVQQRVYKMPIGTWPKNPFLKQVGLLWRHNLLQGLSGFSYHLLHNAFERSMPEIEVSLIDVRRDLCDNRIHSYMPTFVVWGRKPFPREVSPPKTETKAYANVHHFAV